MSRLGIVSVDRYSSHESFSRHFTLITTHIWLKAQGVFGAQSLHLHVIHDVTCLSVRCLFSFCLLHLSLSRLYFLSFFYLFSRVKTAALTHNEEYCPVVMHNPHTGYEPKLLDNFDSETSAMIFQEESIDKDTEPSYLHDAELSDETIGRALSSPLFIQERKEPAGRRQAYHSFDESLLPSQSLSV